MLLQPVLLREQVLFPLPRRPRRQIRRMAQLLARSSQPIGPPLPMHAHPDSIDKSRITPESKVNSPVIVLTKVAKVFGRFAALRDITCGLHSSKLYVIVGENGAGKSTLLRIIAGLTTPTSGLLEIEGNQDVRSVSAQIGYMGHASLLYDEMSGMENLLYFAALYGIADRQLCESALASVGLDPKLALSVRNYSQGMRQRLSLARATVHDPKILLLDEPFSNVDPDSSAQITRRLEKLAHEGKTIVVVTHQPALLAEAVDEFLTISGGRVTSRVPCPHSKNLESPQNRVEIRT